MCMYAFMQTSFLSDSTKTHCLLGCIVIQWVDRSEQIITAQNRLIKGNGSYRI